ncbi:hypothetical protein niasHT_023061 [Heterodera trifolii]|uniref:Uncharacterized protein n=1 Tax=Heterodera trifolii TaxID=157864 RepID=A0ABD2KF72_9BILA
MIFLLFLLTFCHCVKRKPISRGLNPPRQQIEQNSDENSPKAESIGQSYFSKSPNPTSHISEKSIRTDLTSPEKQPGKARATKNNAAGNKRKSIRLSTMKGIQINEPINAVNANDDKFDNEPIKKLIKTKKNGTAKGKEPMVTLANHDESYADMDDNDEEDYSDVVIDGECQNCLNLSKIDGLIGQLTESLHGTETIIDELVNKFKNLPIDLDTPMSSATKLDQSINSEKILLAGNVINGAIIGLYLSFLPMFNENDEIFLQTFSGSKIEEMINALIGMKKIANDNFMHYFDEIKFCLMTANDKSKASLVATNAQLKNLETIILKLFKSTEENPELNSEKEAEFDTKLANLNFYINLYTEMLNMLLDHTKVNFVINSQEKMLRIFKQISAIVDTFLDKLIVAKSVILSKYMKNLTDVPSSSRRGLTHQNSFVIIPDESDEQNVADQMEISDNDKMDDEIGQEARPISPSKNEGQNLEKTQKAMKELNIRKKNVKCQKCNERAKILRMVQQIQKNNREGIIKIVQNYKNLNEQEFTEADIIGTTIYGMQLAFAIISNRIEFNGNSKLEVTLANANKIGKALLGVSEPIEQKFLEFLKISKLFLLADSLSADETALIEAECQNVEV